MSSRSPYDYAVSIQEQDARLFAADAAQVRGCGCHYASSGHMITMNEPGAFASDLSAWLGERAR